MIKTVTVTNESNESLILEVANPGKSGLAIKSIEGLGPSKGTINITELATSDVSIFNSSRINYRTITLNLYYVDCPTIEESRLKTYKYFPIKGKIKLSFETDNRNVYCIGYVEENKPKIFDKLSSCAITIQCPDPFFYAETNTNDSANDEFVGTVGLFSFPFCNDSLTDDLLEFGEIKDFPEQTLVFNGDYSTGIIITLYAGKKVTNPIIYNTDTGESMAINTDKLKSLTGYEFTTGDTIVINTNKGQKSVKFIRDGEETNIIACLKSFKTWFTLNKGANHFTYNATIGGDSMKITYEFAVTYEGI